MRSRIYSGPVKHSVTIEGHQTSISLEPVFWAALRRAAEEESIALNALVARIDEERISAFASVAGGDDYPVGPPANLASAIRSWLWMRYCQSVSIERETANNQI